MVSKIIVTVIGAFFVILGVIMLITPGPGLVFLAMGLGIWSTKFPAVKKILKKVKAKLKKRNRK
jgi:uncharacterized membrane protein HdeD (DUF308 family)